MRNLKWRAAFAVLGLVLDGAGPFVVCKENKTMSPLLTPVGEIPAIDKDLPAKLETATFALG
jgi:hypothetical protein